MYAPVSGDQYVANMKLLVTAMRAALKPGGALIWSTTTPVPITYKARKNSDVVMINGLMKDLFAQPEFKDVLTNDLCK